MSLLTFIGVKCKRIQAKKCKTHAPNRFAVLMLATLKLKIKSGASCTTAINVSAKESDILNVDLQKVAFALQNGSITVENSAGSGDVNDDGDINTGDAIIVLRYTVGTANLTDKQSKAANFNGDCKINMGDAVAILRFAVGL